MGQSAKPDETSRGVWSAPKVSPYVSTGNSFEDVNRPLISRITDALDVERQTMVPSRVLVQRRNKGLTTYKSTSWANELSKHGLREKHPNLANDIIISETGYGVMGY